MKIKDLKQYNDISKLETLEDGKLIGPALFDFSQIFECNHCYFEKLEMEPCCFKNISCYDVVFKNCDFSNVVWNDNTSFAGDVLRSVLFDNCKMVGTDFGMIFVSHDNKNLIQN